MNKQALINYCIELLFDRNLDFIIKKYYTIGSNKVKDKKLKMILNIDRPVLIRLFGSTIDILEAGNSNYKPINEYIRV